MSGESVADDLLRSGYDRWYRLEEEKAALGEDLKELFAELKGHGFAPKALRESFRRVRNINDADQQEHDAIVDLYVASLTGARPAHARVENIEQFGAESVKITKTQFDGTVQTDMARASAPKPVESEAVDISTPIQPETANEVPAQDSSGDEQGESPLGKSNAARPASVDANVNDGELAGEISEEVVTGGESAAIPLTREQGILKLRPKCQRPGACASSGGKKHCWKCEKAAAE